MLTALGACKRKVYVCYLSVTYLLKIEDFFFCSFSAAAREYEVEREHLSLKIMENISEHRTDYVQSVYNCVSREPCPPSALDSHAPFPVTLLYIRDSKQIACVFSHFTLKFNRIQNRLCFSLIVLRFMPYWICRSPITAGFLHLNACCYFCLHTHTCLVIYKGFLHNKDEVKRPQHLRTWGNFIKDTHSKGAWLIDKKTKQQYQKPNKYSTLY